MTSMCVYGFVAIIFVIRLYFLRVSKQNEARIVADGGREYGAFNSKLMVAKNHQYVDHWLFRNIKHPNYFLNIVPELVGIILVCQAWYTARLLLPIYAIIMYIRIIEENKIIELLKVESF